MESVKITEWQEIESVIKKCPTKKNPRLRWLTGEIYQMFKGLTPIIHTLVQKVEGILQISLYETSITLVPKPKTSQENDTNIHYEYKCTNPLQNISAPNPATYKKDYRS